MSASLLSGSCRFRAVAATDQYKSLTSRPYPVWRAFALAALLCLLYGYDEREDKKSILGIVHFDGCMMDGWMI